jgi:hypothetical protein
MAQVGYFVKCVMFCWYDSEDTYNTNPGLRGDSGTWTCYWPECKNLHIKCIYFLFFLAQMTLFALPLTLFALPLTIDE